MEKTAIILKLDRLSKSISNFAELKGNEDAMLSVVFQERVVEMNEQFYDLVEKAVLLNATLDEEERIQLDESCTIVDAVFF